MIIRWTKKTSTPRWSGEKGDPDAWQRPHSRSDHHQHVKAVLIGHLCSKKIQKEAVFRVPFKLLKIPSHLMFGQIHRTLNMDEKN